MKHDLNRSKPKTKKYKKEQTCKMETKEVADPTRDGGFDNLEVGLAEYAVGEAEITFNT